MPEPISYKNTVGIGSQNLFSLKKVANYNFIYKHRWTYRYYRGDLNAKINADYQYALPVKQGDKIQMRSRSSSRYRVELIFSLKYAGDTVYACRSGRVCNNEFERFNHIKDKIAVYHADRSFSEYGGYTYPIVCPGDFIKIGDPIAVIKADEKKNELLYFSNYFLDKNKVTNPDEKRVYEYFVPIFHTANAGSIKLQERTTYVAEITDEMLTQELSDRELKKIKR